jgi:hypothetical protein
MDRARLFEVLALCGLSMPSAATIRPPWNAPTPRERHCRVITERPIADAVIDNCEE